MWRVGFQRAAVRKGRAPFVCKCEGLYLINVLMYKFRLCICRRGRRMVISRVINILNLSFKEEFKSMNLKVGYLRNCG